MNYLNEVLFEFISKLLVRCGKCSAKCTVHSLSHHVRVPLKSKTNSIHLSFGHIQLYLIWNVTTKKTKANTCSLNEQQFYSNIQAIPWETYPCILSLGLYTTSSHSCEQCDWTAFLVCSCWAVTERNDVIVLKHSWSHDQQALMLIDAHK